MRLFLLWVAYMSAAHFFGAFTAGIITDLGFGYVPNWLFLNVFLKIFISLVFLFILSVIGYYSASHAISCLPTGKHKSENRIGSLISTYLLPWIAGMLILILVKIPTKAPQHEYIHDYDTIILASVIFALTPAMHKARSQKIQSVLRNKRISLNRWLLALSLAAAALLIFRFLLEKGIHFIIRFSFSMGFYE